MKYEHLTLSTLEMAYQYCTFGYDEPTHLRAGRDTLVYIVSLLESSPRYLEWRDRYFPSSNKFNNAEVVEAEDIEDGYISFVNLGKLGDPALQGWMGYDGKFYSGLTYPTKQGSCPSKAIKESVDF